MTTLLITVCGALFAYAIYVATLCARARARPEDFVDAGMTVPPWATIFAGSGAVLAGLGLPDHLLLVSAYGLQYSHVAVGLILVALCGAVVHGRIWLAARLSGLRSLGDLLGAYFGSRALRIYLLAVTFLFAVPLAAYFLAQLGGLVSAATGQELPASLAIWAVAFFLFLFSAVGGWRAVVYVVAGQALLMLALMAFTGGVASTTFDSLAFAADGIGTPESVNAAQIPGVIQFTGGIGDELPAGGLWTTVAILTFALATLGLVLSPGFCFLQITSSSRKGFAFAQVWMIGGLAAGALLLIGPVLAAEIAASGGAEGGQAALARFAARLAEVEPLFAVGFLLMLVASLQVAVAFFTGSGASIATIELVSRYILPGLSGPELRLAARIALAALYAAVALAATFAPLASGILATVALSLSAQLLPAVLGLSWIPWVSRSGVLTGLILGTILVVFTEPPGLIAATMLSVELPWGRWPLTIHSAGWGLVFNVAACLLVSAFTRFDEEREHRDRLHREFLGGRGAEFSRPGTGSAKWSLTLIWTFLALGPGAILGNEFFSQPVFAGGAVTLGVPSLFVWQIVFWFLGVLIVWWLAYGNGRPTSDAVPRRTVQLTSPPDGLLQTSRPRWIAQSLDRLVERRRRR